ncbi:restriction endonuclease subunit S [Mycolicibacter sinensis]|uniref:restriction endonuclease subunit S n=1 Tax=Mycolicibacter sinensis (strain JDM601) TaxID=875328 RepID=UPI000AE11C20|nr:restriction endonuclease subunit S [Mycolicibacter sinensis]
MVALGEVAEINPRATVIPAAEEVSFVGMAQLGATTGATEPGTTRRFSEVSKGYTVFRDGDLLVAKITPCFENGKIGQARLLHKVGVGSTEFHIVRPGKCLYDRYLLNFLRQDWVRAQGELRMTGSAGQRRVPASYLAELRIPVPPLDEQRRIAAILDQADALRAKRRQVIAHLHELAQSVFLDMFGDPVRNPKQWKMYRLGDQISSMQYGPRFYNESYSAEGVRIVRITDLDQAGRLKFDSMPKMDVSDDDFRKFCLNPGDIVFARTGATVGKLALITGQDPPCIAGAYFIRLKLKDGVEPEYVAAVLRSRSTQSIIVSGSHQSAQQNFSGPSLRSLPLPLPPNQLQRQFRTTLAALAKRRASCEYAASSADTLFASLQSRAFRGEL